MLTSGEDVRKAIDGWLDQEDLPADLELDQWGATPDAYGGMMKAMAMAERQ